MRALQLQRKKLLAELELSGDQQLHIKDRTFSQSDILEYFDKLQDATIFHYHEIVGKDVALVGFLECSALSVGATFAQAQLYDDQAFRQWISPYFYTAFTEYVYRCLENTDEAALRTILRNPLLLTEYDRERAWTRIGEMLEDNIGQLEHYYKQNSRNQTLTLNDIAVLITDPLTRMILLFPKEPFITVRDKYAFYIMQVCIHIFNNDKRNRDYIDGWMENGKLLAATDAAEAQLQAKHQEMKTLREKGRRNNLVRGAVIAAIILFRFMSNTGFNETTNNVPKFSTMVYDGDTIHDANQLKQAMEKHRLRDSVHDTAPNR